MFPNKLFAMYFNSVVVCEKNDACERKNKRIEFLLFYEVKRILSFLSLKCISWYHCVLINIIIVIIDDLYPKQLRITDTISQWKSKGKEREGELLLFLLLILLMRLFINVVIALILLDNNLCIPLCLHFAR